MKILLALLMSFSIFALDTEFNSKVKNFRQSLIKRNNLPSNYAQLNSYWRSLVDITPEQIAKVEIFGALKSSSIVIGKDINEHFEKLLIIGNLRTQYLADYKIKDSLFDLENLDQQFLLDLKREFQLIPMKVFAEFLLKIKYVKENLSLGLKGFKELFVDLFAFLLLLIVPFVTWVILRRIKGKLKIILLDYKRNRFKSSSNYQKFRGLKILVSYGPDTVMYLLLRYLRSSENSLSFLFAIAEIYFLYKIVVTLCYYILSFVFDRSTPKSEAKEFEVKKKTNSKRIGYFFLTYSLIFHLIQYIVGGGVTSLVLIILIQINIIALVFIISASWAQEIREALIKRTNDGFGQRVAKSLSSKRKWIFSLIGFIYLVWLRVSNAIMKSLERFDFVKQVSAKLFKRKLISTDSFQETEVIKIPADYKELFDSETNDENFVEPNNTLLPVVEEHIDAWIKNPNEENSIAICGHKGAGKSTFINQVRNRYEGKLKIITISFDQRITSENDLIDKMYELLGLEKSDSILPLINADKEMQQTIVVLERCHNLFISHLDGFKAYKKLLEVINTRFNNIFWLATFNENSWDFLSAVYGKNEGFRFVFKIRGWSDTDIQNMILKRHKLSQYEISFDRILRAIGNYDSESMEEAQEQFFRVLWEQSQGNPRIAVYLWLSSLTFRNNKKVYIGLPQNDGLKELATFSDNTLFVYAAIVKHENLSVSQAMRVTNLEEGIVRHSMKLGLENDILLRDDRGQYTFFVRYNFRVINYLKKKNLIIGN